MHRHYHQPDLRCLKLWRNWGKRTCARFPAASNTLLCLQVAPHVHTHAVPASQHSLTLLASDQGLCYSWGRNVEGQLGIGFGSAKARAMAGNQLIKLTPQFVHRLMKNRLSRVSCGARFACGVGKDGKVPSNHAAHTHISDSSLTRCTKQLWTWGEGTCGQLGKPRCTKSDRPVLAMEQANDGSPFVEVACGYAHALAVSGTRRCPLLRTRWPIVAPHSHMCLLPCPASQDVYAWGFNSTGQLGLGDLKTRHSPVAITEQAVPSDEEVNKAAKVGGKCRQVLASVL